MRPQSLSRAGIKQHDLPRVRRHTEGSLIQLQGRAGPELLAISGFVEKPAGRRVEEPAPAGCLYKNRLGSRVVAG